MYMEILNFKKLFLKIKLNNNYLNTKDKVILLTHNCNK